MSAPSQRPDVEGVLSRLKGFQRASVEYAFDRLYHAEDSTRRFLVADEVGLGKTLVAKGIVAKAIDHLWDQVDRIDIVYICSNSQIARQNVNRLSLAEGDEFVTADRLTLLPEVIHDLRKKKVNYLAFTPGTSFDVKEGMGKWQERVLLYWMVEGVWPVAGTASKNFFQGWVGKTEWFRARLDDFSRYKSIDRALADAFRRRLRLAGKSEALGGEGLRRDYMRLLTCFGRSGRNVPQDERREQARLLGRFRTLLAEVCVEALQPDLVILDEFQRFKSILDGEDDAAELARRLFTYSDDTSKVRLLLLSATPYKMYTLQHEEDEDDHYEDFKRTVFFLDPSLQHENHFEQQLETYRRQLFQVEQGTEKLAQAKNAIEGALRRVVCRTERIRSAEGSDGMLRQVPVPGMILTSGDVTSFLALARVGKIVEQPQVLDYWKSAPYLLSFMDSYKLKAEVRAHIEHPRGDELLGEALAGSQGLTLPWKEIEAYRALDPANARLRVMQDWVDQHESWRLLWLPPSLAYYETEGVWGAAQRAGLSKRLVFSTWQVVPKALAALLSYHVERSITTTDEPGAQNTQATRKRRRPLLQFNRSEGRLAGMPVLALLYPSLALARLGDPLQVRRELAERNEPATLERVLDSIEARLAGPLQRIASRAVPTEERQDEQWYWAAPILLDRELFPAAAERWLQRSDLARDWSGEDDDEESRWVDHVDNALAVHRGTLPLGRPPSDLARVIASMALGGPAVCALRALTRAAEGNESSEVAELTDIRDAAGRIAWAFRSLFNQPEAMAIVRGGRHDGSKPYWQQLLEYSGNGQLQAVLDEYVHMLRDLEGLFARPIHQAAQELADKIVDAVALRTSSLTADEFRQAGGSGQLTIETRRLRNHFAMRFGAQESDDGEKGAREDQVRTAFNSPFWPFVLASTSVGQEGLDFHAYCHAIVHWNLPSNPVDLEQREGRVHRFKGHAVRKNVSAEFGAAAFRRQTSDVWHDVFELAREATEGADHGLVPYWLFARPDGAAIERHVPALPLSRDIQQFQALKQSLAVYRMVFGQPRQDDLMAYLTSRLTDRQLAELQPLLRIDLAPARIR